jgi:hypothetical protein
VFKDRMLSPLQVPHNGSATHSSAHPCMLLYVHESSTMTEQYMDRQPFMPLICKGTCTNNERAPLLCCRSAAS